MEFFNPYRKVKKASKDIYRDLNFAWAEYSYIRDEIKVRILNIIDDESARCDFYGNIIAIKVYSQIDTEVIIKIEELLGVKSKVMPIDERWVEIIFVDESIKKDFE